MNRELSLYLDLTRFTAALVVFIGHSAGHLTQGFLWQVAPYLDAAVMVFFVMSGYVIAYVADVKEHSFKTYTIARVSRLSSVVLPALLLTLVCNEIGIYFNYDLYYGGPWESPDADNQLIAYFLSFFLIQHVWNLGFNPPMNGPFWSLSFEFIYYFLFACFFYLKGKKRFFLFLILLLIAGPDIIVYAPTWGIGVLIYYIHKHQSKYLYGWQYLSIAICLISLFIFVAFTPWARKNLDADIISFTLGKKEVLAAYFYAFFFGLHLIFIEPLLAKIKYLLNFFAKPIRYLASISFALYLFHRPLTQMFASFSTDQETLLNRTLVLIGTFVFVLIVGKWVENRKNIVKSMIGKLASSDKHKIQGR